MRDSSTMPDVVDEAVSRLRREFTGRFCTATIGAVVGHSRADLSGVSTGALPELVERLARQRLLDLRHDELTAAARRP